MHRSRALGSILTFFAFISLMISAFVPGGTGNGAGTGWTVYAPLSTSGSPGPAVDHHHRTPCTSALGDRGGESGHRVVRGRRDEPPARAPGGRREAKRVVREVVQREAGRAGPRPPAGRAPGR